MSECLVAYSTITLAVACLAIVGIPQPSAAPPILLTCNQTHYTARQCYTSNILLLTYNQAYYTARQHYAAKFAVLTNNQPYYTAIPTYGKNCPLLYCYHQFS